MASGVPLARRVLPGDQGTRVRALAAAAGGVLAGFWVSLALRTDAGPLAWAPFAALAAGAVAAWLAGRPAVAAAVMAGLALMDLSEVLVRHHGWPSILPWAVVISALATLRARRAEVLDAVARPALLLAAVYLAVRIVSIAAARDGGLAREAVWETARGVVLAVTVAAAISTRRDLQRVVGACLAGVAVLGAIAVVQAATGSFDREWGGLARVKDAHIYGDVFDRRVAGPIGDPNFFAELLVAVLPLGLWASEHARSRPWRAAAALAVAALAGGVAFTYSRGGVLALVLVTVLWILSHRMTPRRLAAIAGIALVLAAAAGRELAPRLATLTQLVPGEDTVGEEDSSFVERRLLTGAAWRMFLDAPVLGVGAGNYTAAFDEPAALVGSTFREIGEDRPHYAHSLPLEIAAETGIAGLAAFAALIVAALWGLQRARRGADPAWAALMRALQLALVAHLTCGLFLHGALMRPLYVLVGLAAAAAALPRADAGERA